MRDLSICTFAITVTNIFLLSPISHARSPVLKPFVCAEHGKYELEYSQHPSVWARIKGTHENIGWACSFNYYQPLKCWKQVKEISGSDAAKPKARVDKTFYGLCRKGLDGPIGYYFDTLHYPEGTREPKQWYFIE